MHKRLLILIDGENLVMRYQDSLKNGKVPQSEVMHIGDIFVWMQKLFGQPIEADVVRVVYYTSAIGDENQITEIIDKIQSGSYSYGDHLLIAWGRLKAKVFKKDRKSRKTKLVDLSLCVDALSHAMNNDMEVVNIVSGDSDYLPLIEQLMRHGIKVNICALSSGCDPQMQRAGDSFTNLDHILFQNP